MRTVPLRGIGLALTLALAGGCGGSTSSARDGGLCTPGSTIVCQRAACLGVQTCAASGAAYGDCTCAVTDSGVVIDAPVTPPTDALVTPPTDAPAWPQTDAAYPQADAAHPQTDAAHPQTDGSSSTRNTGAACTTSADCTGAMAACITTISGVPVVGTLTFPNGYCSSLCTSASDCGANGYCYAGSGAGTSAGCLRTCTQNSDCRTAEGYTCTNAYGTFTQTVCFPPLGP
jgi:hypothetical protein